MLDSSSSSACSTSSMILQAFFFMLIYSYVQNVMYNMSTTINV